MRRSFFYPVGDLILTPSERLYYSDSFLKEFTGAVTDVRERADSRGESIWQLALNQSAFYPTSGGQPFDMGTLNGAPPDGTLLKIPIEQVEEDEDGTVWHFVRTPLPVGTRVEGQIDWARRFDHMQQHTGQHLLSAVFWRELRVPTISFHLGESTSTIDLTSDPLTQPGLERMEWIANEIIGEDRPVTVRTVLRGEAEEMLAAGELRKLPDREGPMRVIDIADLDHNACGGTHLRSTGQIGGLLVRGFEKVSRGVRVEFVCGLRGIRAARRDSAILNETLAMLSTGAPELTASVARLLSDGKANARERQKLREELATFQAEKLAAQVPIENGLRLVVGAWSDRDRDYVKLLASRTAAAAPRTAVIFSAHDGGLVRMFVARHADLDFNCGRILRESLARLGLRGGGSADLAQGEVPLEQESALRSAVSDAMRKAVGEAGIPG